MARWFGSHGSRQGAMSATGWAILLAVLIGLAVVVGSVVLLLEQPRHLDRFARTRRWSVVSLVVSVVATLGVVMGQGDRSQIAVPSSETPKTVSLATVLREVKASDKVQTVPTDLMPPLAEAVKEPPSNWGGPTPACQAAIQANRGPSCEFGDRRGSHTMVLYGDSHAAMWFQALDDIAIRAHWRFF